MDANGSALLLKRLVYVDVAADVAAAWDADVAAAAAMAAVRRPLDDIGVIGPAATFLLLLAHLLLHCSTLDLN